MIFFFPQAIAVNLHYPRGAVKHIAIDEDEGSVLSASDIVVYGSFHEEQSFPEILIKAMCIGKPIVAPDLHMIRKYVCFLWLISMYFPFFFCFCFCCCCFVSVKQSTDCN